MELSFQNVLLGVLAVFLHLVSANEAYGFSTKHGLSIINPNDVLTNPYSLTQTMNRDSFPPGFIFGFGSSAYQTEGAWNVDGKGPSQWDNFTHTYPERIEDKSNGDNATNAYYLYQEDIRQLEIMNADAYWFSISWSRVLPNGRINGGRGINYKGIEYYNNLIDVLISKGLKPCVTMYFFDLPQALQDEYGGLLNGPKFREDFVQYADLLFRTFGDRVKQWVTINDPLRIVTLAYDQGAFPPNRCSSWVNKDCFGGDSATEPYIVAHNLLLAHADVVQLYRSEYKEKQEGIIGIILQGTWPRPYNYSNLADHKAAGRYIDFTVGLFLSPITFGYYPQTVRDYVGERLPEFTEEQSLLLRGSIDFLGFNYFSARFVYELNIPREPRSYFDDIRVGVNYTNVNGTLVGEKLGVSWQYSYPKGIWRYLRYIKRRYNSPIIYITGNGASEVNKPHISLRAALRDNFRMKFFYLHLSYLKKAIDLEGANVKGYFAWSLTDNFEWNYGYTIRFGIIYVDHNNFARYKKLSAVWFKRFLK